MRDLFGNDMRPKLLISFSGGRTSGYMLHYLWFEWQDREKWNMKVVFANTGKEDATTLLFVRHCEQKWNIPIVWVEGYPSEKGKGWSVVHKIVDFWTAAIKGEPFEAMIKKLGIPSTNAPFCSDQLKRKAIESYLRSVGWRNYHKAIGIRADEMDRVNPNFKKKRIIYPLLDAEIRKPFIYQWWDSQDFNLLVKEGLGNCDNCWKKDLKTLCSNARKYPDTLGWWKRMTTKYGDFNPRNTHLRPPFNFYRGNLSPWDIQKLSELPDQEIDEAAKDHKLDGCTESCEPF